MESNIIRHIEIKGIFNQYSLKWNLNEDVNILIGINGGGKTTVMKSINALLSESYSYLHNKNTKRNIGIYITFKNGETIFYDNPAKHEAKGKVNHTFITTFDVPLKDKTKIKQSESPLDKELRDLWYTLGTEDPSFFNYRLKTTHFPEEADKINTRIRSFFNAINHIFSETQKTIDIAVNNEIIFRRENDIIPLTSLSSGEKQLLLILLSVFLMEEQAYILLMDEPEISLHIGWQQQLVDIIRNLNPNCQIIMATHSPSIFGKGWGDKMFFIEDLMH